MKLPVSRADNYSVGLHILAGAWWSINDADGNEVCRVQAKPGEMNTDLIVRVDELVKTINKGSRP